MAENDTDRFYITTDTTPRVATAVTDEATEYADGDVIDVDEVARMLRIGRKSVYEGAARKELPHRRIGRRLIFSRRTLARWLACRSGW
jgi:excisionase family DNA binding protein